MLHTRRTADCTIELASGIEEDLTETNQLLEDLIKERDAEEEQNRKEKDKENATEALFVQEGEDVQQSAVFRICKE